MNKSFWELETIYKNPDLTVVGAGFSGLWTALTAKQRFPDLQVLVVEKNIYPLGASTRNAGFACFGSITEILSDAEKMGWEQTLYLLEKRFKGLQRIQSEINYKSIDYKNCGGYELLDAPISQSDLDLVNQKLEQITNQKETFTFDKEAQNHFGFAEFSNISNNKNIVFNALEGSLHPGKLLEILIQKCYTLGIRFLWNTEVENFESQSNHVEIQLDDFTFNTKKLVFCTNGFTPHILPDLDIQPARGQVIVTSPIPSLKLNGVFHSDEGYIYFRNLGNRVLLGGMRNVDFEYENSDKFAENKRITKKLESYLSDVILPNHSFDITHRWSGIMAMGKDKSYLLNQYTESIFYAVRLSGMGVALAPEIGNEVVKLIYD